jgi:lipopolysaccharide-binding protein
MAMVTYIYGIMFWYFSQIVHEKYPNSAVAIAMEVMAPPKLTISSAGLHVAIEGNMNFSVFPQFVNDRTPLFSTYAVEIFTLKLE